MAAPYTVGGDSFTAGQPREWLGKSVPLSGNAVFDLTPDGKRVVLAMPASAAATEERPTHLMTFLLNFADELKRKAPPSK